MSDLPSPARDWLSRACGRGGAWHDAGALAVPSRTLFVGDPTWGSDAHMDTTLSVDVEALRVWALRAEGATVLVWLEAGGGMPLSRGASGEFGVDAACFAFGDEASGHAFTRLTDHELDAGRGDSFEWIGPHIQESVHFVKRLAIPPDDHPMIVVGTGADGGYAAVPLHDAQGVLSGILIDIMGREPDGAFLDTLLPERP